MTTWVSQYQKGRTILDFNKTDDGVAMASAGPYANQTDNHTSTSSLIFMGWTLPYTQPTVSKH